MSHVKNLIAQDNLSGLAFYQALALFYILMSKRTRDYALNIFI